MVLHARAGSNAPDPEQHRRSGSWRAQARDPTNARLSEDEYCLGYHQRLRGDADDPTRPLHPADTRSDRRNLLRQRAIRPCRRTNSSYGFGVSFPSSCNGAAFRLVCLHGCLEQGRIHHAGQGSATIPWWCPSVTGSPDPSVAFRHGYSGGLAPPLGSNVKLETTSHICELGFGEPRSKAPQPGSLWRCRFV